MGLFSGTRCKIACRSAISSYRLCSGVCAASWTNNKLPCVCNLWSTHLNRWLQRYTISSYLWLSRLRTYGAKHGLHAFRSYQFCSSCQPNALHAWHSCSARAYTPPIGLHISRAASPGPAMKQDDVDIDSGSVILIFWLGNISGVRIYNPLYLWSFSLLFYFWASKIGRASCR